jgi:3-dehydroquinate dehydratase/shikimate dehydrogenase
VIPYCTKVDGAVRGTGAVNTILFQGHSLIGFNTDYRAAMDSLDDVLGVRGEKSTLQGRTALVLGAGGVAKAIAFGLRRRNADVVIASRTESRAAELAEWMDCRSVAWAARYGVNPDIVVNCTPVGMHPNVDESPYDRRHLRPSMTVFDTVYNPEQTLLVKEARLQHCTVITGVDMFVRQAALQFQHFTGQPAPTQTMRDVLKRTIGPVKY